MAKLVILLLVLGCFGLTLIGSGSAAGTGELIPLASVLPKLQAIHEDAQTLLIKNSELKSKILVGLQAQNEAKLRQVKESKLNGSLQTNAPASPMASPTPANKPAQPNQADDKTKPIDYSELDEFNRWVEVNLEYAVKNTQASAEALKEEAAQNNGNVDYSEQAIKDGIEGVKYWQSAVIFQDKTLNNEKFDTVD